MFEVGTLCKIVQDDTVYKIINRYNKTIYPKTETGTTAKIVKWFVDLEDTDTKIVIQKVAETMLSPVN